MYSVWSSDKWSIVDYIEHFSHSSVNQLKKENCSYARTGASINVKISPSTFRGFLELPTNLQKFP